MAVLATINQLGAALGDTFANRPVTRIIADGEYAYGDILDDLAGAVGDTDNLAEGLVNQFYTEAKVAANAAVAANTAHAARTDNPHSVSAAQVGAATPGEVAAAQTAAIAAAAAAVSSDADVAANSAARHDPVTLSGTLDYLTLSGQDIVRGPIDLSTDVGGILPLASLDTPAADGAYNIGVSGGVAAFNAAAAGGDFVRITQSLSSIFITDTSLQTVPLPSGVPNAAKMMIIEFSVWPPNFQGANYNGTMQLQVNGNQEFHNRLYSLEATMGDWWTVQVPIFRTTFEIANTQGFNYSLRDRSTPSKAINMRVATTLRGYLP